MDLYASAVILTVLLMVTLILHVVFYRGFTKEQKFWFLATFVSIAFCTLAEFAVHCGRYDPSFAIILTILTVTQFSLSPLLGVFFTGALGLRREARYATALFGLNFLIQIIAAPFGWIFRFDSTGYHRGDAFIIYEIFYLLSLLYLVISLVIVGRRFKKRDIWTIAMLLVILAAGIAAMTFFQLHVAYLAIGMAAAVCYIYYNDLVQQDIQAEFAANQKKMSDMQVHMISGLANFIENRDLETGEHNLRTSTYVKLLAESAREDGVYADVIDDDFIAKMSTLAPMHDIGKIVVPDAILQKPGKLTPEEFQIMKRHTSEGGKVIRGILSGVSDEDYVALAEDIAMYHHEWWNGNGYPEGLKGERIPLCARIMAIADVYDALTTKRCYKDAISPESAIAIIEEESGTHFDPKLVDVFLRHKEAFIEECKREEKA